MLHRFSTALMLSLFVGPLVLSVQADSPASETGGQNAASLQGGKVKVLFDGKSLEGWSGRDDLWSVEDGMIVGRTTEAAPIAQNTFLILDEEIEGDFELMLQFKLEGGNSGIQYRSVVKDASEFVVGGYQADFDATNKYSGILYEERGRGILAMRGQNVTIGEDGKKKVEKFAEHDELAAAVHAGKWNDYRIVARGNTLEHYINGTQMIELTDNQTEKARTSGVIALQLHVGPAMNLYVKNITIRQWD